MGRPKDQFAWAQVEELENGTWKCIHCEKLHSGAASRIRNHLSGQGNGIAACEKASEAIQNEALRKVTPRKRARGTHSAVSSMITSSSSINDTAVFNERMNEGRVTEDFVKFQMCHNAPLDVVKEPLFRKFMEGVGQYGVPSSLLGVDSSLALEKSALRIKCDVESDMATLRESWKTTGCTMMVFDLNNYHGKGVRSEKDMTVIAIYSPNGIIFVDSTTEADDCTCRGYYIHDLKRHSPRLDTVRRVHWLRHSNDSIPEDICELNRIGPWQRTDPPKVCDHRVGGEETFCLRSQIQEICTDRCFRLYQMWAVDLFQVAVKIHDHLWSRRDPWYYSILTEKDFSLESLFKKKASRIPIFLLIIQQYPEEESSKHHRLREDDIEEITKGHKFWNDGRQVALILDCVLKFADVMDTIVPTSGYFDMAFDKVKNTIEWFRPQLGEDALQFWNGLNNRIESLAIRKIFSDSNCRLASSYLNPVYFLQQLRKDPRLPADKLKTALKDLAETQGEHPKEIDKEVDGYAQVFSKLSIRSLEDRHPVKLWEEYGRDLPVLRTWALELLNRPLSCLCKQVKEHLYQLHGAEDYILRLNLRMMCHFQHLGDDIYKPLDLSQFDFDKFKNYIVNNEPRSEQSEDSEESCW